MATTTTNGLAAGLESSPTPYNVVKQMAQYIAAPLASPLPPHVVHAVLKHIADTIGAAAPGITGGGARGIRAAARSELARGDNPIWFTNQTSSTMGAAWANSAAASELDSDDGHALARGHPGAPVIATALAVAHEVGATDEHILEAVVKGYQVGIRISAARKTYGNTGTWGAFAVVAAAATLHRTPQPTIEHAMGIAGETGPNMLFHSARAKAPVPEGCNVKEGIPASVVAGFLALRQASAGFTGARNLLDSTILYDFPQDLDLNGEPLLLTCYMKPYACCRHIHAPLAAALALQAQHGLSARDIESITVEGSRFAATLPNKTQPQNLSDLQYSLTYLCALVLYHGTQPLLPVTAAALHLPEVEALAAVVTVQLNPEFNLLGPLEPTARVSIVCGGKTFVSDVTAPEGGVTDRLSWAQIQKKNLALVREIADERQQGQIRNLFQHGEQGRLEELRRSLGGIVLV